MTTKTKTIEEGESCPTCLQRSPKYNGWTNYETWAVALWLDNEQESYKYWSGEAKERLEGPSWEPLYESQTREDWAKATLADCLKEQLTEEAPTIGGEANLYADLLTAALGSVNWYEIAEHYIDAAKENA